MAVRSPIKSLGLTLGIHSHVGLLFEPSHFTPPNSHFSPTESTQCALRLSVALVGVAFGSRKILLDKQYNLLNI